jgi:hypothetical protein
MQVSVSFFSVVSIKVRASITVHFGTLNSIPHISAVLWSQNFFFRSSYGSDFQKVSAPAPAPTYNTNTNTNNLLPFRN